MPIELGGILIDSYIICKSGDSHLQQGEGHILIGAFSVLKLQTSNFQLSFFILVPIVPSLVCLISSVCTGGAALWRAGQHGVGAAAAGARQGG